MNKDFIIIIIINLSSFSLSTVSVCDRAKVTTLPRESDVFSIYKRRRQAPRFELALIERVDIHSLVWLMAILGRLVALFGI